MSKALLVPFISSGIMVPFISSGMRSPCYGLSWMIGQSLQAPSMVGSHLFSGLNRQKSLKLMGLGLLNWSLCVGIKPDVLVYWKRILAGACGVCDVGTLQTSPGPCYSTTCTQHYNGESGRVDALPCGQHRSILGILNLPLGLSQHKLVELSRAWVMSLCKLGLLSPLPALAVASLAFACVEGFM